MKQIRALASLFAAAVLSGSLLLTPAFAGSQDDSGFSALQGVEAQALSSQDMDAISGELNAYNIAAALFDTAAALTEAGRTRLATAVTRLAVYYQTNAESINAAFVKLGVYTCVGGGTGTNPC
jgi:hypothetical protein